MSLRDKISGKVGVNDFVSTIMFSRDQAHVFHLQTNSYAKHMALDGYYKDIVDLFDSLVETYQGTNNIILSYSSDKFIVGDNNVIKYFEDLLDYIKDNRKVVGDDSDLQNIIDEIVSLIKGTLYKLKNLR